jgi:hypothetical protein
MKVKLLVAIFFIYCQISFCQSITGKVISNKYAVAKVDVINSTQKIQAVSDTNGDFLIVAKANDILVFVSKDHDIRKISVPPPNNKNEVLIVELVLKAEELSEVVITNTPKITLSASPEVEQIMRDEIQAKRADQSLKPPMIFDLKIDKGLNLIRIGGFLADLLKKEKEEVKKTAPLTRFTIVAKGSFERKFFLETLRLKPEEIDLFLQFCENDPQSDALLKDSNELAILEFLLKKNTAFKKL